MSALNLKAFKRRNRGKDFAQLSALLKAKNNELKTVGGSAKKNVEAQIQFLQQELDLKKVEGNLQSNIELLADKSGATKYGTRNLNITKNNVSQPGPVARADLPQKLRVKKADERVKKALNQLNTLMKNPKGTSKTFSEDEIKAAKMRHRKRGDEIALRALREANMMNASENQGLGGTSPTDVNMNVLERLVSKVIGKNVRFEDIPDDDPEFDVGYKSEGHFAHPAGRPDLRKGGITQKQRARIKSIVGQYNQKKKAKKTNGKRTNR